MTEIANRAGGASALPALRGLCPAALLPAVLLLSACGASDNDPGPGGVTVGEARALDRAAAMLDSRPLPAEALQPGSAAPAAVSPEPSGTPAASPR
ncbi:hypothetical protein [Altererythrobacter sp. B11]|uniref:hypothetical protein n=1 Tax=Altererythrobacter sp. B11 TaxID=2060312 RepID=UPI001E2E028C|nr:hypothetical protein [Altererythrobacter sp. B11]